MTTEIFRFIAVRPATYASPDGALQLKLNNDDLNKLKLIAAGKENVQLSVKAIPNPLGRPVMVSTQGSLSLNYQTAFTSAASQLSQPTFDASTTASVLESSFGVAALSNLVSDSKFTADQETIAFYLILAHLAPNRNEDNITLAASFARIAALIDAIAGGATVTDMATLSSWLNKVILAPSGVLPVVNLGPAYNTNVAPAGIGDLQVVNQQLSGYELREISYIENVLATETNTRTTVRFEENNQTFVSSSDTTNETEQDTQSNQRFQVQTQAQNTIKNNSSQQFGASVSAAYGPYVQAKSNFSLSSSQANTSSSSTSTSFAKDITSRAVSKVTQEVKKSQRLQIINSFRETVEHGFTNTQANATNISGVYQYVDELYEVGVFNYGSRMLFDLVVPNPAGLVRATAKLMNGAALNAYDPPPINFKPSDLTVSDSVKADYLAVKDTSGNPVLAGLVSGSMDYTLAAQTYQVTGLEEPPQPITTVTSGNAVNAPKPSGDANQIAGMLTNISIPDGYMATKATVIARMATLEINPAPTAYNVSVQVGGQQLIFGADSTIPNVIPPGPSTVDLDGQRDNVAVAIGCAVIDQYQVTIEVTCVLTSEAFTKWQLDTYSTIYQSYLRLQSDYQQALSQAQQAAQGTTYGGASPDENQRIISQELKRELISLISNSELDTPPTPMTTDDQGLAPPSSASGASGSGQGASGSQSSTQNVASSPPTAQSLMNFTAVAEQGPMIRFLEEAFEWDQMQYVFYPYYWMDKDEWFSLALLEDSDPLFAQFLRSGAARVVVPVRPAFNDAVLYYLQYGQAWDGAGVPSVHDPLYLPIATELAQLDQQPQQEVLVGEPWQMRLPTTLVMLRSTPTLPSWTLDPTTLEVTASS